MSTPILVILSLPVIAFILGCQRDPGLSRLGQWSLKLMRLGLLALGALCLVLPLFKQMADMGGGIIFLAPFLCALAIIPYILEMVATYVHLRRGAADDSQGKQQKSLSLWGGGIGTTMSALRKSYTYTPSLKAPDEVAASVLPEDNHNQDIRVDAPVRSRATQELNTGFNLKNYFIEYHRQRRITRILKLQKTDRELRYRQTLSGLKKGFKSFLLTLVVTNICMWPLKINLFPHLPFILIPLVAIPVLMLATDLSDFLWRRIGDIVDAIKIPLVILIIGSSTLFLAVSAFSPQTAEAFVKSSKDAVMKWHHDVNQRLREKSEKRKATP